MSDRRDMEQLINELVGWTVRRTGKNHWRLTHDLSGKAITAASSPSDNKAIKNTLADIRRVERGDW